ncbi:GyrI-like domain-containing protein [Nocardioides sp. GXZ039]|uniref:GyrI-like domain-containing protein n=1 Tax=Nocardioides sp. GXZ039 TaxID=3136018 RepID=UPI0030F3EBDB
MPKVDLKRELPSYRARTGVFDVVEVPPLRYLMIDGHGDPNDPDGEYAAAITTIFPVAYKLKFARRAETGNDYVVMPLEALWWADDMASFTAERDKSRWHWTMLNLVPDDVTDGQFEQALSAAADKGASAVDRVRLDTLAEGRCVQTLHLGPYDDEGPVLAAMHDEFIPAQGLQMTRRHHEIYLNDVRRTDPWKLRTILRQPVSSG